MSYLFRTFHPVKSFKPGSVPNEPSPLGPAIPFPSQAVLIRRRATGAFVLTTALIVAGLVTWAALTDLDKVTRGSGKVVPQTQNQLVQHFEGGIVSEILVREGEAVTKGQPMLRVENSFARAELEQSRIELKARTARLLRLSAEAKGADNVDFPADLVAEIPKIIEREQSVFQTRRDSLESQRRILDDQIRQKELELDELKSRWTFTRNERELVDKRINNLKRLVDIGAVSNNDMLEAQRAMQQVEVRLSDLIHDIPRTEAALGELRSRREDLAVRSRADAEKESADTELQVAKLREAIAALQDRSQRADVLAPVSGIVNKLFVNTVGGVVKSGDPLVQIVPADAAITIEAKLAPNDRAQVWPGLPAVVKISAYEYSTYGGLPGKVVDISPDALQDERGQPYFRVRLEADGAGFGPDRPVVPGMTADVDILSGRQSVLGALIRPIRRVASTALRE